MRVVKDFSPYPFVAIFRFSTQSAHCSPETIRFHAPTNDQPTDGPSARPFDHVPFVVSIVVDVVIIPKYFPCAFFAARLSTPK